MPDVSKQRLDLVRRSVNQWVGELIDVTGRNNLLHYRELRVGTLDLSGLDQPAITALLQGRSLRTTAMFAEPTARDDALRRLRAIYAKAKENLEERGLDTVRIGVGLATWNNATTTWQPAAPVLLRRAEVRPLGAALDEFEVTLAGDTEINPTLLHVLRTEFACTLDEQALMSRVNGVIDQQSEIDTAYDWLRSGASGVEGFAVQPRLVLGNFSYAKLPMVRDLKNSIDDLAAHDVIAAIAGDQEAQDALKAAIPAPESIPSPDDTPLADEFLVLDADASQNYAINAVLAGENLVIKGPPGTGKSQSIANLIAALIARGEKVLFVAEKRAAIDAVLKRLAQQHLDDLVLNLHGGVSSKKAFAQDIGKALVASRVAPPVDFTEDQHEVEVRRDELNLYERALHGPRAPWNISVYDIRAELMGAADSVRNELKFSAKLLKKLNADTEGRVRQDVRELAALGGFALATSGCPWASAAVRQDEEVPAAYAAAEQLLNMALEAEAAMAKAAKSVGSTPPETPAGSDECVETWRAVAATSTTFEAAVFEQDLDALCSCLSPAHGTIRRLVAMASSGTYRRTRGQVRSFLKTPITGDRTLLAACEQARESLASWRQLPGASAVAKAPDAFESCADHLKALHAALDDLVQFVPAPAGDEPTFDALASYARGLIRDQVTLVNLPKIHRIRARLVHDGLEDFVEAMELAPKSADASVGAFRFAWLSSLLDAISLTDSAVGGFIVERHSDAAEAFRQGDRRHLAQTPARIRRLCATRATASREANGTQAQIVERQAVLKRGNLSVRAYFEAASDVLLALKPCFAMSPLGVSQLLPAKSYFDVVIFDEASQVTPADAITSILRGKQVVVAGDEHQLPPTAFFATDPGDAVDPSADPDPLALTAGTLGFESILDSFVSLLQWKMLTWHYRSRDERLIAFSNAHIYDRSLTTFAGIEMAACLQYVAVPWEAGSDTNSPAAEVRRVVDLIIDHARRRPAESLGVIAMGIKHSDRIDEALRDRLRGDPALAEELADFFDESRDEPFFVKNLERVQGDERDAIILSVGYGKNDRGQLVYRFGPLLAEGGVRRLNVAITRAKKTMTLVASFSHLDMDPARSNSAGVELLRQYIQYIQSNGTNLGDVVITKPELNPFEIDVRDTLVHEGLKLIPQYGSSGYWIDFAVQHPDQPGRFVLAIECDGAMYHSCGSARDRDRLRQEQLERIGWRFHRIWSTLWFHDKSKAKARVMDAYAAAIESDETNRQPRQADLIDAIEPAVDFHRSRPRPPVPRGCDIAEYSSGQLMQLVRWIESDGRLRTEDEVLVEVMTDLGFQRRGNRIVSTLRAAIRRARGTP